MLKATRCNPAKVAETGHLGEGAFNHPPSRQQHETALSLGQLHDLRGDAV